MSEGRRVADIVARTLAAHGIRLAFGMPGGEVVTLLDGLRLAGIEFILARHETAAAMMAAGAYSADGAPGLLVTTVGPGLANAVNGIADAAQERVPLIVISGVVDHGLRGRYTHQVFDQAALLRPLVKGSFEIEADGVSATVARAIGLALAEPMGPVHLDLAPRTAALAAREDEVRRVPTRHAARPAADDPVVEALRKRLAGAKRPVVIAGHEAARNDAGAALADVMRRVGAPVVTTYKAKGVVDESLPLALGGAGLSPLADGVLLSLVKAADVVILAGYDPIEMRPGWLDPFGQEAFVADISRHPADHGMHRADISLAGDVGQVMRALSDGLAARETWQDGEPAKAKAQLKALFAPRPVWGPHAVFDELKRSLPADATVTVDSGAHRILLSQQMQFKRPKALLQSAGLCTMGSALPLAIGVAAAHRSAPVVAVLGDGGLEMSLGELGTVRDQRLPIVVMVLQDESLALIELKQTQAGLERSGVRLGKTRYEDVAVAFGGHGVRVKSRETLSRALLDAFRSQSFTVIVCEIEAGDYAQSL